MTHGTLYLDLEVGDTVHIGTSRLRVERKTGAKVRLRIMADRSIPIRKIPMAQEGPITQKE